MTVEIKTYCGICGIVFDPSYPHDCKPGVRYSQRRSLNLRRAELLREIKEVEDKLRRLGSAWRTRAELAAMTNHRSKLDPKPEPLGRMSTVW